MNSMLQSLKFDPVVFLAQIVIFIALVVIMRFVFWEPMLANISKRDRDVDDAYRQRDALEADMHALRDDYQRRMAAVEAEARTRIQESIKDAQAQRELLLNEAREQAEEVIRQGIASIDAERAAVLAGMTDQIAAVAATAAANALGGGATEVLLRRELKPIVAQATGGGTERSA
ncbi:MAG: ATP synthase F0 subunit B [Armatimonadetes bacterium]|nr:ATP synthase F0 subunit B [Armatimonadota bacterium]MDE2205909.1 ATP synthase F0 subunit B [Armatimonadota bacterium]